MSINLNHSTNTIKTTEKLTIEAEQEVSVSDTRVTDVEDPIESKDAVNKRFLENTVSTNIQNSTFLYTNSDPMPEEVGGYEIGDTFDNATLQQLFTNLLYPYQYPAVTSFSISGQPTTLEVGDKITGGVRSFNWNLSHDVNVAVNSITIQDVTNNVTYQQNLSNDNQQDIDIGNDIVKTSDLSNTWRLSAQNTKGQTISRNFNVYWRWRTYYGTSNSETLTENEIKSLTSTSLDSNFLGNKSVAAGGYKYFAYPVEFGVKTRFMDSINGFAVAMEQPITVSITNAFGIANDYYLHRTTNPIVGSLIVAVEQ